MISMSSQEPRGAHPALLHLPLNSHLPVGSFKRGWRIPCLGFNWSSTVTVTVVIWTVERVGCSLCLQCSTAWWWECESSVSFGTYGLAEMVACETITLFCFRLVIGTDQGFTVVDTITNRCLYTLCNLTSILCKWNKVCARSFFPYHIAVLCVEKIALHEGLQSLATF